MYYYKWPFTLVFGSNILDVETKFIATIDLLKKTTTQENCNLSKQNVRVEQKILVYLYYLNI